MEDLYLLKDGTHAAPADCSKGKDGVLANKSGMPVALDAAGNPETVNKGAVDNMNVMAAEMGDKPVPNPTPAPAPNPAPVHNPAPLTQPSGVPLPATIAGKDTGERKTETPTRKTP